MLQRMRFKKAVKSPTYATKLRRVSIRRTQRNYSVFNVGRVAEVELRATSAGVNTRCKFES